MKKVMVLLLSGLFLYGCGTGAGTTASNGTAPEGVSQASPVSQAGPAKSFTLKLVDSSKVAAKTTINTSMMPNATDVRVVIRRYETVPITVPDYTYDYSINTEEGIRIQTGSHIVLTYTEVSKNIQDVSYNAEGIQVSIPQSTGYTIDVITSIKDPSGNHSILKYGQGQNIEVGSNSQSATIIIKDLSTILNMTVADNVLSTINFNVNLNNVLPLDPNYQITMNYDTDIPSVILNSTNKCSFTAPASYTAGTVYLQGKFTLNKSFMTTDELKTNKWTRTFPNSAFGEEVSSLLSPLYKVTIPL